MTPERWALVTEVFSAAVQQPQRARTAFLSERCGEDLALRAEVAALLESDAAAAGFLESAAVSRTRPHAPGDRLGAWELESLLGHGGMGEVWLASRADGAYRQRAALKVVRPGLDDGQLARRFVEERQILAALSHPHIARLLDGGAADDGSPWLAMEYVEGQPLDAYCRGARLSLRARVELFVLVCEAVSAAHRQLVVHRDLKPANVLVLADGTPRLLDFGIARLLGAGATRATQAGGLALTPRWASPEQVRGEPVATTSDVFSLGVMLFELLAGFSPWGAADTPEATLRAVLEADPVPSGLEPDLDAVLGKALEKDVARRYPSVESLAQDLARWLSGHPVLARAPTAWGRLRKAVSRNRALSALGAAVFLSLVGGLVATSWQARIAARERALAQRRFEAVRGLANTLIFEVHDTILYLPGATEARTVVATRAVLYLDELAQDTRDPAVRREVVAGYQKVAEAQHYSGSANLGDAAGAERNYQKALALQEAVGSAATATPEDRATLASLWLSYGTHLREGGEVTRARDVIVRALALREQALAAAPGDPELQRLVANAASYLGDIDDEAGRLDDALRGYERVRDVYAALVAQDAQSVRNRWGLVCGYGNTASVLRQLGQLDEARVRAQKALALTQGLLADRPDHYTVLQGLGAYHQLLGEILAEQGDLQAARAAHQAALKEREALAARDANDVAAALALVKSQGYLAALEPPAEGAARFAEVQARLGALLEAHPGHRGLTAWKAELAVMEAKAGGPAACQRAGEAQQQLAALHRAHPEVAEFERLQRTAEALRAGCP